MSLTVADLRQHIEEKQAQTQQADRLDLGRGISIEAEAGMILIIRTEADPDDYAVCGYVEHSPQGDRWIIYRAWYDELAATFGSLPERVIAEAEAA